MRRDDEAKAERDELLTEIRQLRGDLRAARKERDDARDQVKLADEIVGLKKELVDLEIKKDRTAEAHEREKREVTHMVGLEKKRQEFEIDQAKRETTVTVREENLAADRARFEQQMTFTTERFQSEVGYLKDLMGEVLDRLPTVTVDKSVTSIEKARKAAAD